MYIFVPTFSFSDDHDFRVCQYGSHVTGEYPGNVDKIRFGSFIRGAEGNFANPMEWTFQSREPWPVSKLSV